MADNGNEGCGWGCLGLIILGGIIFGINAAIEASMAWIIPLVIGVLITFWAVLQLGEKERRRRQQLEKEKNKIVGMIDEALGESERARVVNQIAREEEGDDPDEEEKRFIKEDIEYTQEEMQMLNKHLEKLRRHLPRKKTRL